MNFEQIQIAIEELQEELRKAKDADEREYLKMILKELVDIRLLVQHIMNLEVDYLRIGPADEMGWQHDGSTTEGTENVVNFNGDFEDPVTDGDIIMKRRTEEP